MGSDSVNDPQHGAYWRHWAGVKKRQADMTETLASIASGCGNHKLAGDLWEFEGRLRRESAEFKAKGEALANAV